MFASSGDTGAFECLRDGTFSDYAPLESLDPASQPWVTSAGGTSFESFDPGSNPNPSYPYGTEAVWNTLNVCSGNNSSTASSPGIINCGTYGAGGGGHSIFWPMPNYQRGPGVINPVHGLRPEQLRSRGDGPTVPRGAGHLGQRGSPHRLRGVLHRVELRLAQPERHRLRERLLRTHQDPWCSRVVPHRWHQPLRAALGGPLQRPGRLPRSPAGNANYSSTRCSTTADSTPRTSTTSPVSTRSATTTASTR